MNKTQLTERSINIRERQNNVATPLGFIRLILGASVCFLY